MSAPRLSEAQLRWMRGPRPVERPRRMAALLQRLLDEHADLRARTTWQPIKTVPSGRVLLRLRDGRQIIGKWDRWDRGEATHWLPMLPEPPP